MRERYVGVTPRLQAVLDMLVGCRTVADIGCDHGRLTAALLQRNVCERVIATDVSLPSLEKAKQLIGRIGLCDRVSFRAGDGLRVLFPRECDAIALLGMGGTLMCRILDECSIPLLGAKAVVLQPMRAQDDIRSYLYRNRYHIADDRVVLDHGRYYQIIKATPGDTYDTVPGAFPRDFYDVGYHAFASREPLLPALCREQLKYHSAMLRYAVGTEGETVLSRKVEALQRILQAWDEGEHE